MNIGGIIWVNTSNDFFQWDFQLHPRQSFWNQWHSCAFDWEKPGSTSPSRIPTAQRLNLCTTLLGWWWYMAAFRLVRDMFDNDETNMMVRCRWSVNSRNGSKSSWRIASVLSWCLWCTSCGRRCLGVWREWRWCECLWHPWHYWAVPGLLFHFFLWWTLVHMA